jgi:signal peptidase II
MWWVMESSAVLPEQRRSMLRWTWLALLVIVLDQVTKLWANAALQLHMPQQVFTGFNLTLSYNSGAAFSFLAGAGGWQRWFFIVLALLVSGYIVYWLRRLGPQDRPLAVALALILGGALGNVIDRIWLGHVVDFIDVYYLSKDCLPFFGQAIGNRGGSCHWPAFNIADSAITLGALLLVIDSFSSRHKATN